MSLQSSKHQLSNWLAKSLLPNALILLPMYLISNEQLTN
jgi:hypothetical protein